MHELNAELAACFGLPIDVTHRSAGLAAIARALGDDKLFQAQVATLHLQFPDPPDLEKGTASIVATVALARMLRRSGLLKADWDPAKHPRWPAGDTQGRGGEFAPIGGGAGDPLTMPLSDFETGSSETVPQAIPAQLSIPAPVELPFPGEIPFPPQFEFVPPPLDLPNSQQREFPKPYNPYPNKKKCVEEWDAAYKFCDEQEEKGNFKPGYAGFGEDYYKSLRGQVSQECGGNSTQA